MISQFVYNGLIEHLDGIFQDVDEIIQHVDESKRDELMEIKKRIDFRVRALKVTLSLMRDDKSQEVLSHLRK